MLKLEETDVKTNDNGFVIVDEYQKTSVDGIYAIGDIAGNPMLAHKATHEVRLLQRFVLAFLQLWILKLF